MRKSFILGSVVAATLTIGGLSGIAQADSGAEPDAAPEQITPTTIGGDMSLEQILSILTPDQLNCLVQNMGAVDPSSLDINATMALLTQCGISLDQLTGGATGALPTVPPPGATVAPTGVVDAATTIAVLGAAGLGIDQLNCIAGGMAAVTAGDDAGAFQVLQTCGVSLSAMLSAFVTLASGGSTTAAAVPTVPGGTTAPVGTNDMMTQLFIDTFESMGMTLTADQASCLAQNSTGVDTADQAQLMSLLQTCGINITDLMAG